MIEIQLERFRNALEAKEYELEWMVQNRAAISIEKAADAIDEVRSAGERDLAICNLDRESKLLFEVRSALRRMKDGTFGICQHCEEEISVKRLDAVPWAPHCIACQELTLTATVHMVTEESLDEDLKTRHNATRQTAIRANVKG